MELRQLEYVVAVVDQGGFTRAAEALHVAQPSLSQSVRTLERELGVELFHRVGRGVVLSSAGAAFVEGARQVLRDVATTRAAVAEVAGATAGSLDLVSLPTLTVEPLAGWIGRFRAQHPGVTVRVLEPQTADAVLAMVRDGTAELGLAELVDDRDELVVEVDLQQEVFAVSPPGTRARRGRLPLARLAGTPLVATPPGTSTRRLVDEALAQAGVEAAVAVEVGEREALLPLVLAGAGTTFLPAPQARAAGRQGAVVARLDPPLTRRVGVVRRPGAASPAARAFLAVAAGGRAPAGSR